MNGFSVMLLLAQTGSKPAGPGFGGAMLPALMFAMIAFMLLSSRSQKKREKRERDEMYARMSKNDRVQTAGGVIGIVHAVKANEVVLKVDETTNTKMTFLKSSVIKIITDDQTTETAKS